MQATLYPGKKLLARFYYYERGKTGPLTLDQDRIQLRPGNYDPSYVFEIVEQHLRVYRSTINYTSEQFAAYLAELQKWVNWPVSYRPDGYPRAVGYILSVTRETIESQDVISIQLSRTLSGNSRIHLPYDSTDLTEFYVITSPGRTDSDGVVQPNAATRQGTTPATRKPTGNPAQYEFKVTLNEANASVLNETGDVVLNAQEIVEGILYCDIDILPFFGTLASETRNQVTYQTNHMSLTTKHVSVGSDETVSFTVERIRRLDARRYEVRLTEDAV